MRSPNPMPRARAAALLLLLQLLAGCAAAGRSPLARAAERARLPGAAAADLAAAGFHDWLHRNDPASAQRRFAEAVAADPRHPWARLGAAWMAQRSLDDLAEAQNLLALLAGAPDHALSPLAARRLAELAEVSPALGASVEAGLAPILEAGKLRGLAAYRARVARAAAAEARGDAEAAARHRGENGSVTSWTLAGPCGAYHALEIGRPFPPEQKPLPARWEGPPGLPPVEPRPLLAPEGSATLEGEPPGGDIWYLASDVRLSRGGRYLVTVGATAILVAWLDGEPLAERRADAGFPPTAVAVPRELEAGSHRLLLKVGRGGARAQAAVSFARADGAPSDAESLPAPVGEAGGAAVRVGRSPPAVGSARAIAAALESEGGPALARLAAARDRPEGDREAAKALLDEAMLDLSAVVLAARGDIRRDDPTLGERVARARAEAAYQEALAKDPGDAATRLKRAELMRAGERLEDAQSLLSGLSEADAARPRALVMRARVALARSFAEVAERLAEEARRKGGDCQALELLYDLASRRDAVAREDQLARAMASCPGGRERLADHLRLRGDPAGAVAVLQAVARAAPSRIEPRFSLARALAARGEAAAAAAELADLSRIWPREPRIQKRLADALELAGDRAGARAARERALRLDGSDLQLRRALAMEDGAEALDAWAEDGRAAIRAYEAKGQRPSTSSSMVLDAAAVEVYPDGSYTERVHQVVQVLDQRGVERWGEVSIPPGSEILLLRNLKKDGRALEPEDAGGEKRALSLPGLEPGDYVEYEYLRSHPSRGPALPGFSADPFFFRVEEIPLWRSSYVVAAPRGFGLEVDAHHLPAPEVKVEGDREVLRALRTDVPALVAEPAAPGISEYLPFVQAGAGPGREAWQLASADAVRGRTRVSREVAGLAAEIANRPGAQPLVGERALRAAYERVNRSIEGQGGSWNDAASQVLSRGRGNRTLLLKAVCEALGQKARLALVRGFSADPEPYRFSRPDLYGHSVLRVETEGRVFWLDPSTRLTPFGVLPGGARGAEALVLPEPGEVPEMARTPAETGQAEGREIEMKMALDAQGDASVEAVERYLGFDGAAAKAALEQLDAQARRQAVEQSLSRSFRGLALESLSVEGEQRADEPLVLRWRARVRGLARLAGGAASVDTPLFPVKLGARFVARADRETPLLLPGDERQWMRVEISLPPGATPEAGEGREITSDHGSYRRMERVENGHLVREDRFQLRRGRVRPEAYPAFARFAGAVDEAQGQPMRLGGWR